MFLEVVGNNVHVLYAQITWRIIPISSYYVAFSGPVPGGTSQRLFTIGNGVTTRHDGVYYPNPPPSTGVDYRVFIRVYSGINVSKTVEMGGGRG